MNAGDIKKPVSRLPEHDLLEQGFNKLFPQKTNVAVIEKLKKYMKEIELFNEAYGLVKVSSREELIIKHILDSISPLPKLDGRNSESGFCNIQSNTAKIQAADVGSGAGLPGIPLAICLPDTEFTLIERMGRRAGFLRNCAAVLELPNVRVEETEMEQAEPARFDIAVFRALRPLEPDILKALLRLIKPDGMLAAWKGRMENAREEMQNAAKNIPGLQWEITPIEVPYLNEKRCLVIINNLAASRV
ncbi:MAG: 16S rRNA (guanine(527)-N(7))-methyltransferase RsmG [Treponema sp.]|nr:16S rRNA (guanine(527)-N(7))-methyltransferase RsmG [Treponema sp.]